mgnify:CR=1 FL=1
MNEFEEEVLRAKETIKNFDDFCNDLEEKYNKLVDFVKRINNFKNMNWDEEARDLLKEIGEL